MNRQSSQEVLVTILEENDGGYFYPRVFTPHDLAMYLHGREMYNPGEHFRVWDINADGEPCECRVESESSGYDADDWAHVNVRVVNAVTNELVLETGYRMDGRA